MDRLESSLIFISENSHKQVKTKNILACTNLSKLNNSSQLVVGMYCPGVQHSTKIISVHKTAANKLYFKSSFIIKTKKPPDKQKVLKYYLIIYYAPINAL